MLLLSATVSLRAECIIPPQPCPELNAAEVVFYGEVLNVVWHESPITQDVQFNIVRTFKGNTAGQWLGTFHWGAESYTFEAGQRVVVYATFRDGEWKTACSRTRAFALADKALLEEEMTKLKRCVPTGHTRRGARD